MNRVGAGGAGGVEDEIAAQIGLGGGVARQPDRGVGGADMGGVGVGVGEHRDGADAHRAAGREDPAGDFAAVGDQDRRYGHVTHILKTPKRSAPLIDSVAMADKHIPSTVRVSRGSMTPSS
ncbi:hypothetical protein C1Y40_00842 [Mycobacterium talmoniae]|uniref:Uncharacterized protein n=1 Tax=Mycobacterium talmoniae TaxID=1858794 RepID=A0A2S8BQI0_9MYCO|nr:hypothetical protein C1Y40_00842 [Mycobacterium talmoniae]